MAAAPLTPDVCGRLRNASDYLVLVQRPTLRVTKIEELEEREIGGFLARWRATLKDGTDGDSQVVFPDGSDFVASIAVGAVIKIDQMVRVPNGRESVIVVYSGEAVTLNIGFKMTDMDQEICRLSALLQGETQLRRHFQERLQALQPANLPVGLVDQFFDALIQFGQVPDEVVA